MTTTITKGEGAGRVFGYDIDALARRMKENFPTIPAAELPGAVGEAVEQFLAEIQDQEEAFIDDEDFLASFDGYCEGREEVIRDDRIAEEAAR